MHASKLVLVSTLFGLVAGCSDDGTTAAADESSSGGGSTTDVSASSTVGMSSTSASTTTPGSTTVGTSADGSESDSGGGFINPDSEESGPTAPGPNGAQCGTNEDCESAFCYTIPMVGGVCSECLADADCEMGTCAIDAAAMYAVCTDGSIGNMCDSDEGCAGELVCTELIDTGGLFNASFCSDCGPSAPCAGEQICTPIYDAASFAGYLTCADPGSVENGGGCPLEGGVGNDAACMSGHCGVADLFMGFVQLGVCGECNSDADCVEPATCTPAGAGGGGLMGAVCQ